MKPYNSSKEILSADDPLASSATPITIGITLQPTRAFEWAMAAGQRIEWEVRALFTLGATGGFRFLADGPGSPTSFNASFFVVDLTTGAPAGTPFNFGQTTEAAVANASAVAGTYKLWAYGSVVANAAGTFAFKFAQNASDALPITIKAGATFTVNVI